MGIETAVEAVENVVKPSVFCEAFPNGCGNPCSSRISISRGIFHSLSRGSFSGRPQRIPIFDMGKIRRKFEGEFKQQLIEQVETGQITVAQAAREYQVSRSLIDRWRKQYHNQTGALADQPSPRERRLEAENEKLKAKVGDLVMQIEHLKKPQTWVQRRKDASSSAITAGNLGQFRKRAK